MRSLLFSTFVLGMVGGLLSPAHARTLYRHHYDPTSKGSLLMLEHNQTFASVMGSSYQSLEDKLDNLKIYQVLYERDPQFLQFEGLPKPTTASHIEAAISALENQYGWTHKKDFVALDDGKRIDFYKMDLVGTFSPPVDLDQTPPPIQSRFLNFATAEETEIQKFKKLLIGTYPFYHRPPTPNDGIQGRPNFIFVRKKQGSPHSKLLEKPIPDVLDGPFIQVFEGRGALSLAFERLETLLSDRLYVKKLLVLGVKGVGLALKDTRHTVLDADLIPTYLDYNFLNDLRTPNVRVVEQQGIPGRHLLLQVFAKGDGKAALPTQDEIHRYIDITLGNLGVLVRHVEEKDVDAFLKNLEPALQALEHLIEQSAFL